MTEHIDIPVEQMQQWYTMTISEIGNMVEDDSGLLPIQGEGTRYFEHLSTTTGSELYYRDNGGDILFVHHMDTVQDHGPDITYTLEKVKSTGTDIELHKLNAPVHDDRLGLAIVFSILPGLTNGKYDYLLTSDEEIGQSTAQFFTHPEGKRWRMIVEFDRRGTDAVLYSYSDKGKDCKWYNTLKDFFTIGTGSFSDICYLTHLNAKGVNIGTGYQNAHSADSYTILEHTAHMVWKYTLFEKYVYENDLWFPHPDDHYAEKKGKLVASKSPPKQLPMKHVAKPYHLTLDEIKKCIVATLPIDFAIRPRSAERTRCDWCASTIDIGEGYIALKKHHICDACYDHQRELYFPTMGNIGTLETFLSDKSLSGDYGIVAHHHASDEIVIYDMTDTLNGISVNDITILAGTCMISNKRISIDQAVVIIDNADTLDMLVDIDTFRDTIGDDKLLCSFSGEPTKIADMALLSSSWGACISKTSVVEMGGIDAARTSYPSYLLIGETKK